MTLNQMLRAAVIGGLITSLTACGGGFGGIGSSGIGSSGNSGGSQREAALRNKNAEASQRAQQDDRPDPTDAKRSTIWDLFTNSADPNTTVEVNKYIWNASLEILNFLPIQSVDPFTGVITTGYGVPPGGGRAYRATVYVQDPALDARSLKLALQTRGGQSVSKDTVRAVEDAILTRARQLRIRDSKL